MVFLWTYKVWDRFCCPTIDKINRHLEIFKQKSWCVHYTWGKIIRILLTDCVIPPRIYKDDKKSFTRLISKTVKSTVHDWPLAMVFSWATASAVFSVCSVRHLWSHNNHSRTNRHTSRIIIYQGLIGNKCCKNFKAGSNVRSAVSSMILISICTHGNATIMPKPLNMQVCVLVTSSMTVQMMLKRLKQCGRAKNRHLDELSLYWPEIALIGEISILYLCTTQFFFFFPAHLYAFTIVRCTILVKTTLRREHYYYHTCVCVFVCV